MALSSEIDIKQLMGAYLPLINQTLEKWCPRKFSHENIEQIFGPAHNFAYDVQALNKVIAEPIWELLDRGLCRFFSPST
jgi:hypothetical protein